MRPILVSTLVVTASFSLATLAHADALPPNAMDCGSKSAGATCRTDDQRTGKCVPAKCNSINRSCDAAPCDPIVRDCLLCAVAEADAGAADSGTPGAPDSGTPGGGTASDSSSCSVSGRQAAVGVPLVLFALGLGLFAGRRARRDV